MKLSNLLYAGVATLVVLSSCSKVPRSGKMEFKNQTDSVSYALGFVMAKNLKKEWTRLPFKIDSTDYIGLAKVLANTKLDDKFLEYQINQFETIDQDAYYKGFLNELAYGRSYFDDMMADVVLRTAFEGVKAGKEKARQEEAAKNLEDGKKFLDANAKRSEVKVTGSGLQYEVLKEGNGAVAGVQDRVKCTYHGTLIDGTVFDSSVERGDTATFRVTGVIKGWTEALQLMPEGSKWRLYVPSDLAYGERGSGQKIGGNETLIFDIDLVEVMKNK